VVKSRGHFRATTDHPAVAAAARAERGTWFLAAVYGTLASAQTVVRRLPRAIELPSYEPAGDFEAYAARHDDGHAVWVRYIGGDGPLPELPETMTVRALCPLCGGPRGFDTIRPQRFHEDGDWYTADRWHNRCGHVDSYSAILREARSEAPAPPVVRSRDYERHHRFAEAIELIRAAAAERRVHHAKQAAQLLDASGHSDAGDLIRAEIKARHGHMSALQAAGFLRDCAPSPEHHSTDRKDFA
jgi:hypothetical protein